MYHKIKLFYSYSHKDENLRDELNNHLTVLKRTNFIEDWYDRKISAGSTWEEELNTKLNESDIILLLISSNFLASNYCYDSETIRALEKHEAKESIVIPVILKPCLWNISHFAKLQALPKDAKPITTWSNQDEGWLDVANGILSAIERVKKLEIKPKPDNKKPLKEEVTPSNPNSGDNLDLLILNFLVKWSDWYFSPLRIQKWGSKNGGFPELANYSSKEIGERLKAMLKEGKVKKTTSRKGNAIYKLNG